jgi:hypothetical protein
MMIGFADFVNVGAIRLRLTGYALRALRGTPYAR